MRILCTVLLLMLLAGCELDYIPSYIDREGQNAEARIDFGEAFANTDTIIGLVNYAGNRQNTHPKVLYFADKLYNHKYWMAYTPYPKGKPQYENPCIAYSDNGKTWFNILKNPIDKPQQKGQRYNSDTHLVYNPRKGVLETWFRYADEGDESETIYRMTSTNGIQWQSKEALHTSVGAHCARCLSPAVLYDGNKYQIWVVNAERQVIEYYESRNGDNWEYKHDIALRYDSPSAVGYTPWHLDVIKDDGIYRAVVMAKHDSRQVLWTLFYTESIDNATWTTPTELLHPRRGHWDEKLYRSSLVRIDDGYALYYAGRQDNRFLIGVTWAKLVGHK